MIAFKVHYTASAEAKAVRLVRCEECDTEYVYHLQRTGQGYGDSYYALDNKGAKRRAARRAQEHLDRRMRHACEVVPCPECGHVQRHMFRKARFDRATKIGLLAIPAVLLMLLMLVAGEYTRLGTFAYALSGLFCLAGLGIGLTTILVNANYNPNRRPEAERIALGEEKGARRKEFEKAFAAMAADEFDDFRQQLGKKKAVRSFAVVAWADPAQVKHGDTIRVPFPTGERAEFRLPRDVKDGDEFKFEREVDGVAVTFACTLNVYTRTKS